MLTAKDVAEYFLSKDPNKKIFNKNIMIYNGIRFYEGNVKLNKYLFLSQVVYLAKYGKKLFEDDFIAYDNGPVIEKIRNLYVRLKGRNNHINLQTKIFLDKIYLSLENATTQELIEISHEDPEWQRLKNVTHKNMKMDVESNIKEYKERYEGLIKALKI